MDSAKGGLAKVSGVLCGTACSIIWIGIMFAIPIACLVLGAQYQTQCTIEPYIPIYLLVAGSFGVLHGLLRLVGLCCQRRQGGGGSAGAEEAVEADGEKGALSGAASPPTDSAGTKCVKGLEGIVGLFIMIWFFVGCKWVYSVYSTVEFEDTASPLYCHRTLYLFAFWLLTATFILIATVLPLVCVCVCCCACCAGFAAVTGGPKGQQQQPQQGDYEAK